MGTAEGQATDRGRGQVDRRDRTPHMHVSLSFSLRREDFCFDGPDAARLWPDRRNHGNEDQGKRE